ncbi:hypothetical protein AX15_004990 [Amanita polypyramis BW_CC]|nr:hypothetical protein AX15_004990 [Amanita polypyramis BW_CC]
MRVAKIIPGYMTLTPSCPYLVQPEVGLNLLNELGTEEYDLDYLEQVFVTDVDERYYSLFRVVPGKVFIDNFASDRSHMVWEGETDESNPRPPEYPPIIGTLAAQKGVKTNLMSSFVCMERTEGTFGTVLDVRGMKEWLGSG